MATDLSYVIFVVEQIKSNAEITYKKMFGEYLIYANAKPVITICKSTPFVKMLDCVKPLLENAETGYPYDGAKEHYIVNVDDSAQLTRIVDILEQNVPLPKPRKKKDK
jgi:TfoX/Sxy family transcriptional regulator of competence genes